MGVRKSWSSIAAARSLRYRMPTLAGGAGPSEIERDRRLLGTPPFQVTWIEVPVRGSGPDGLLDGKLTLSPSCDGYGKALVVKGRWWHLVYERM